jgi:hypothetical protein
MRPFTKRLCIVLWVLWALIGAAWAIGALFVTSNISGGDVGAWVGSALVSGLLLVLFQYLLTGLWRPADLIK